MSAIDDRAPSAPDRRTLLKLMGASLALGGLAACTKAQEIVPYVSQPENVIPGRPLFYATTLSDDGYGIGAIVESHEGRPTKIEGNPDHPASRGATDAIMQAAAHSLFDPERSRTPLKNGEPAGYGDFLKDMAGLAATLAATQGKGAALLIEATTSPTVKAQLQALRTRFPALRIYRHDPLATTSGEDATHALFGKALMPVYHFDRADTILSLDADFLGEGPGRLAYARDFAARRRVRNIGDGMSRLYAVESTPTLTGAAADHHKAVRPSELDGVAAALDATFGGTSPPSSPLDPSWLNAAVRDLKAGGRNALVVPGSQQSPFVHAAAFAANIRLGALGNTLHLIEPPHDLPVDGDLPMLCQAIVSGETDRVIVLAANPLRTAPAGLDVHAAFTRLKFLVHWGLYQDETATLAHWHIPAAHDLESWSDLSAFNGTVSIVQPLISPLFGGRTIHELLAAISGVFDQNALALLRGAWADKLDEPAWKKVLRDGVIGASTPAPVAVGNLVPGFGGLKPKPAGKGLEIRFVADPFLRDGRHANSSWLQELPRPLTKIVWGNAALMSPAEAARRALGNGHVVNIARNGFDVDAPVWTLPGHPDGTVTLSLGFGGKSGSVARMSKGYDAFRLRTAETPWFAADAVLAARDRTDPPITTQHHHGMEGRHVVRRTSLDGFRNDPHFVRSGLPPAPTDSLYPGWTYPQEAWGMSIDLSACIGCMACVAACQAENNIATVGPEQCELGHEMHWLRVDRYSEGPAEDPETFFQPVPCMHCEKAPCEIVCPVNATVHTHDGLNAQVYNRCIGTRYCSQNCPYKVRRFNFLQYRSFDKEEAGPEQAARNPDVSVRSRGVMEKCTYCVQRISEKRIRAQVENRDIADGEVLTACQQVCPTHAITFGDINRKGSKVAQEKAAPHSYALLEELNTRPRTTYLGKISNTDDALALHKAEETGDG
ncbi:4Fe-4S dicluster domain-containing protein [Mesorhizobium sp. SP-1A]|uniref:4Fe-4S dicluster domain-containing protein n=1 Tax=Mesorhizobium sp. SP-1A TaxID=3077840 RepID=UPI0028F70F27|nr:4Fe-4S dicluster domain-containing protein [Mesorhizobium sp. SP-1A]